MVKVAKGRWCPRCNNYTLHESSRRIGNNTKITWRCSACNYKTSKTFTRPERKKYKKSSRKSRKDYRW